MCNSASFYHSKRRNPLKRWNVEFQIHNSLKNSQKTITKEHNPIFTETHTRNRPRERERRGMSWELPRGSKSGRREGCLGAAEPPPSQRKSAESPVRPPGTASRRKARVTIRFLFFWPLRLPRRVEKRKSEQRAGLAPNSRALLPSQSLLRVYDKCDKKALLFFFPSPFGIAVASALYFMRS